MGAYGSRSLSFAVRCSEQKQRKRYNSIGITLTFLQPSILLANAYRQQQLQYQQAQQLQQQRYRQHQQRQQEQQQQQQQQQHATTQQQWQEQWRKQMQATQGHKTGDGMNARPRSISGGDSAVTTSPELLLNMKMAPRLVSAGNGSSGGSSMRANPSATRFGSKGVHVGAPASLLQIAQQQAFAKKSAHATAVTDAAIRSNGNGALDIIPSKNVGNVANALFTMAVDGDRLRGNMGAAKRPTTFTFGRSATAMAKQ